jgi:hypothetical protein
LTKSHFGRCVPLLLLHFNRNGFAVRCLRGLGLRLAISLFFAFAGFPGHSFAQSSDNWVGECWVPDGAGTTIFSITPQAGIAGVTRVYIIGTCFGDSQGTGGVSIGGVQVPASSIFLWSDGEIGLVIPFTAQTGALEVDSQNSGSDTSTNEAGGNASYFAWSGNGQVNATFTVLAPSYPPLYYPSTGLSKVDPAGPSPPRYVEGTWNYNDGYGDLATYTLGQGPTSSDGTSSVSGTVVWSYGYDETPDCTQSINGTLEANGYLNIVAGDDPVGGCGGYGEQYIILNSGDATSQGYFWETGPYIPGCWCSLPPSNFPSDLGDYTPDLPLFKSQTEIPNTESPAFLGWLVVNLSPDPTYGAWQRTLPLSSDGIIEFSGRFVFEQSAPSGRGYDGCYQTAVNDFGSSPYDPFTTVTGGGWYVNGNGIWGSGLMPDGSTNLLWSDDIGINSDHVDWYQQNVGQCSILVYQTMFIDSLEGAVAYNASTTTAATNVLEIDIDSSLGSPLYCTGVIPNGSSLATECQLYPPQ